MVKKKQNLRAKAKAKKIIRAVAEGVAKVAKLNDAQKLVLTPEQRQEKVFELRIKGVTIIRIADVLGVDKRTIDKDIAAIKAGVVESVQYKIDNFNEKEYFGEVMKELSLIKNEMWAGLVEGKRDRSQIASVLTDLIEKQQQCLRSVGVKIADGGSKDHAGVVRIIHETVPSEQFDTFGKEIKK